MASYPVADLEATHGDNGWGSYSDFNNKGPNDRRYTTSASYDLLLADTAPPPVLSKDWSAGEGRREAKDAGIRRKTTNAVGGFFKTKTHAVKSWFKQGNRGKLAVFVAFFFICALALTLYFVIPRAPSYAYGILASEDSDPQVANTDASFSWKANLTLKVDSSASYVPLHMTDFDVQVSLLSTGVLVGSGKTSASVSGHSETNITVPITFSGQFGNKTDATYAAMLAACGPIYPTTDRGTLDLTFAITTKILGLIGHFSGAAQETGLTCPIAFSSSHS
ncbi:hypothetical protein RQP46_002747 [Phenoliferia psychrophenolica]